MHDSGFTIAPTSLNGTRMDFTILVGKGATGTAVRLLPAYANRHGLVAGATGTG